ncbi:MAG: GIY-YIG nuclease family protein [Candidatus Bathyarchaeia archaeon]
MPYYVYVILCDDGSFYTGYTKNVGSRMRLHVNGKGARYTRLHKPKRLVYTEEFNSRAEAMRRERRVKAMRHDGKLRLMRCQARVMRNRGRRNR